MKFSVCIPNYNYERYIGRTIASVLAQDYGDFEIVVSDNASTDTSVRVIRDFNDPRIRLRVNRCNVGFAGNLDRAGAMATGEAMILLSSDDVMYPAALRTYAAVLAGVGDEAPRTVIGSAFDVIDSADHVTGRIGKDQLFWADARLDENLSSAANAPVWAVEPRALLRRSLRLMRNPYGFLATAYPRSLYEKVEGYGGGRLINPDKWFTWKLLDVSSRALFVDAPLFGYRWHSANQNAQQEGSGALKHLVDQYVSSFELDGGLLERTGLTRPDLAAAFIENDVALRGLRYLADGRSDLARRGVHFGRAAYPRLAAASRRLWLLRALLLLGPLGRHLAAAFKSTAIARWRSVAEMPLRTEA